jgi:hypothetical protein
VGIPAIGAIILWVNRRRLTDPVVFTTLPRVRVPEAKFRFVLMGDMGNEQEAILGWYTDICVSRQCLTR